MKNIASGYLKDKCGKTAAIDLDELYKNIDPDFSAAGKDLQDNWLIARKSLDVLTDYYCKNKVNTVFTVGPFSTTEEIKVFTNNIKSYLTVHVFTLRPSDEVVKIKKNNLWIDNSDLTPKQILDWIVEKVFS